MSVIPVANVKAKFETGDIPTGTDFEDLIDTCRYGSTDNFEYTFAAPSDTDNDPLHFEADISDTPDFSNIIQNLNSTVDVTPWQYFSGNQFETLPSTGLEPGYYGYLIGVNFSDSSLKKGVKYYIRYRSYDGSNWSDYRGDIKIW